MENLVGEKSKFFIKIIVINFSIRMFFLCWLVIIIIKYYSCVLL